MQRNYYRLHRHFINQDDQIAFAQTLQSILNTPDFSYLKSLQHNLCFLVSKKDLIKLAQGLLKYVPWKPILNDTLNLSTAKIIDKMCKIPNAMPQYTYLNISLDANTQVIPVNPQIWDHLKGIVDKCIEIPWRFIKGETISFRRDTDFIRLFTITENRRPSFEYLQYHKSWTKGEFDQFLFFYVKEKFAMYDYRLYLGNYSIKSEDLKQLAKNQRPKTSDFTNFQIMNIPQQFQGNEPISKYIKPYYVLFLEITQRNIIKPMKGKIFASFKRNCQNCYRQNKCEITCICQRVFYCQKACYLQDVPFHSKTCNLMLKSQQNLNPSYIRPPQRGIFNIGNTCYVSSSIQALLTIPKFIKLLKDNCTLTDLNPLTYNLSRFIVAINKEQIEGIWDFKIASDAILGKFLGFQQHDIHDYLIQLLDKIETEQKKSGNQHPFQYLQGATSTSLLCKTCKFKSKTQEKFRILTLSIPSNNGSLQSQINIEPNASTVISDDTQNIDQDEKSTQISNQSTQIDNVLNEGQLTKKTITVTVIDSLFQKFQENIATDCSIAELLKKLGQNSDSLVVQLQNNNFFIRADSIKQNANIFVFRNLKSQTQSTPFKIEFMSIDDKQFHALYALPGPLFSAVLIYKQALQILDPNFCNHQLNNLIEKANKCIFSPIKNHKQNSSELKRINSLFKTFFQKLQIRIYLELKSIESSKQLLEPKNQSLKYPDQIIKSFQVEVSSTLINKNLPKKFGTECVPYSKRTLQKQNIQSPNKIRSQSKLPHETSPKPQIKKIQLNDKKSIKKSDIEFIEMNQSLQQLRTLQQCWNNFSKSQTVKDVECRNPACKKVGPHQKIQNVTKMPEILMIHFNRLQYSESLHKFVKNYTQIFYTPQTTLEKQTYHLIAVIFHIGTSQSGHYIAYCLRGTNFIQFNDHQIRHSQNRFHNFPFILIYEKLK